jgi:hypothetical protein
MNVETHNCVSRMQFKVVETFLKSACPLGHAIMRLYNFFSI